MNYQMDYFYGHEANQFTFFRIPKLLFSDERFIGLTSDAKILYGLMLDRMGLSVKNGWIDEKNHVYIYFTLEETMEYMHVGKDKGVKLFAELDDEKGCGLIKKKKQGLGKPTIIYVMNFVSNVECPKDSEFEHSCDEAEISETTEVKTSGNAEVKTSEKPKSGLPKMPKTVLLKNRTPNFVKTEVNNNDFNNNNKKNNTDFSDNNLILSYQQRKESNKKDVMDEIQEREEYRELISDNIEYEFLVKNYSQASADDVLETMLDAVCSKKDYIWLGDEEIPQAIIKSRLLKLDYGHIEYALDSIKRNYTNVRNPKKYLLATLYNSITSLDTYYTTAVNYDMHGNN